MFHTVFWLIGLTVQTVINRDNPCQLELQMPALSTGGATVESPLEIKDFQGNHSRIQVNYSRTSRNSRDSHASAAFS
jgi:hypothetical protein